MSSGPSRTEQADRDPRRDEPTVRQFVGFRLDGEDYAIAITKIREIILMKPITRLPQVPESIEGLINLRGTVIPIVNLRKKFALASRPFDDETRTIVVTVHDKTVGCIVDEVTQVMRIATDQIQPVPVSMAAAARRFVSGLARLEERLIILLDTDKLFTPDELDPAWTSKAPPSPQPRRTPESAV